MLAGARDRGRSANSINLSPQLRHSFPREDKTVVRSKKVWLELARIPESCYITAALPTCLRSEGCQFNHNSRHPVTRSDIRHCHRKMRVECEQLARSESECLRFRPYEHRLVEQPPQPFRDNPCLSCCAIRHVYSSLLLQAHREVSGICKAVSMYRGEFRRRTCHTSLLIPSLVPSAGAQGSVGQPELTTRSKVLTLGEDALVIVDVVLPAVLGLVHVGETGVDTCMKRASC